MARTANDSYGFLFHHASGPEGHRYQVFVVRPTGVTVHDLGGEGRSIALRLKSPLDLLEVMSTESERVCRIAVTNAEQAGFFRQTEWRTEGELDLTADPWQGKLERA